MIRFIDLFAGIGGFHQALKDFGAAECVFASEIDTDARNIYTLNHGIIPSGDISTIDVKEIPSFDLLCAGFPCQPFSKGGKQIGFNDVRGTLFFDIVRILKHHKPDYVLLENVANLVSHDKGNTYSVIINSLKQLGYVVPDRPVIISPTDLGIPVNRPRTFIPAVRKKIRKQVCIDLHKIDKKELSILDYFNFNTYDSNMHQELFLNSYEVQVLQMWDEFYQGLNRKVIGFPIWFDFFKYPKIKLNGLPKWKINFIEKNKLLYIENKNHIDNWTKKYKKLKWVVNTHRKFEWQCGTDCKGVFDGLIQFRPSGIRVKRLNFFSTLVAMNHPQIIGPMRRRLHADETKYLQSFDKNFKMHPNRKIALKQLGNAVNVDVVKFILEQIILK